MYEVLRWNDEDKEGQYWADWQTYEHTTLGTVEIGGPRGMPPALNERMRREADLHYKFLLYIADLSPLLRIEDLTAEQVAEDEYHVVATLKNHGYLPTYVSRKALEIRRDNPILAEVEVSGGEVIGGAALQNAGHILGQHTYIWRWGAGADESTLRVEWRIRSAGGGPVAVSVLARASQAGEDRRSIRLGG